MEAQVTALARSVFYHLRLVRQLVSCLSTIELATVIHALFPPQWIIVAHSTLAYSWTRSRNYNWYRIMQPGCWLDCPCGNTFSQCCISCSGCRFSTRSGSSFLTLTFKTLSSQGSSYLQDHFFPHKFSRDHYAPKTIISWWFLVRWMSI